MCGESDVGQITAPGASLTVLGIFAYCSYLVEKDRKYICDVLCNGLARQEYRGYDSAGELCLVCPLQSLLTAARYRYRW
jgi:hypothetical protein